jgi:hypothetical protein
MLINLKVLNIGEYTECGDKCTYDVIVLKYNVVIVTLR